MEPVVYGRRELMEQLYEPDGAYFVVAWNKLYQRELFAKIRYPLGQIHEDEATTHQIFHLAGQGAPRIYLLAFPSRESYKCVPLSFTWALEMEFRSPCF